MRRALLAKIIMVIMSVSIALGSVEVVLRLMKHRSTTEESIEFIRNCGDCPYLFSLNPKAKGVSAQGLRDRLFTIPKPPGVLRVLVLGDSVTAGRSVPPDETFAKLAERQLTSSRRPVEVINAGVSRYTPYNELEYYLAKGRSFQPDVVVLQFCMNDVADPELHWGASSLGIKVPKESIPNKEYHEQHVRPLLEKSASFSFLERLETYALAETGYNSLKRSTYGKLKRSTYRNGTLWSTEITGEDDIGLQVLLDVNSPEWRWLSAMYRQIIDAVHADHAVFVLLIVPLSYQMDPEYPFLPQSVLRQYCESNRLLCLDLLPEMRKYPVGSLFVGKGPDYYDIWHLNKKGHEVTASALVTFLGRNIQGLAPVANLPPSGRPYEQSSSDRGQHSRAGTDHAVSER